MCFHNVHIYEVDLFQYDNFFHVFSLERSEYEPLICEWVEEVLNRKVVTPNTFTKTIHIKVEEVLNYKVTASDEVLNNKVTASDWDKPSRTGWVEEVLNCKVITPRDFPFTNRSEMGEVLNCKVIKPIITNIEPDEMVEEVLNCKVITPNKTSAAGNRQQSPYPLF